jgi:hypothetical protein
MALIARGLSNVAIVGSRWLSSVAVLTTNSFPDRVPSILKICARTAGGSSSNTSASSLATVAQ